MRLSEMLLQNEQKSKAIKTIKVKKVRDLLGGGQCYTTLTGKKVYILDDNNDWFTPFGKNPLDYNFIIVD